MGCIVTLVTDHKYMRGYICPVIEMYVLGIPLKSMKPPSCLHRITSTSTATDPDGDKVNGGSYLTIPSLS